MYRFQWDVNNPLPLNEQTLPVKGSGVERKLLPSAATLFAKSNKNKRKQSVGLQDRFFHPMPFQVCRALIELPPPRSGAFLAVSFIRSTFGGALRLSSLFFISFCFAETVLQKAINESRMNISSPGSGFSVCCCYCCFFFFFSCD